jgi:hypothetical protein
MQPQNSTKIILVCAPAGSGFREAIEKLTKLLRNQFGEEGIAVADVEDFLCKSAGAANALRGKIVTGHRITMREVTWNLTRGQVIDLWRSALAEAIVHLQHSGGSKIKLLACHLHLYGGKRKEFYSPLDVSRLRQAGVSHLLLLIDDIFDMYARLTTYGHLHDEEAGIRRHVKSAWDEEGKEGPPGFAEEITRDLSLEWRVQILASLIAWRHAEMMLAESLASQLEAHYLVFGTKQIAQAAIHWFQDSHGESVYLSHPISRPRRSKRDTDIWPPVVEEFNRLQQALLDEDIVSIMPTAIDEFRFVPGPANDSKLRPRLPILEPRWPFPSTDRGEVLYASPMQDAPEYTYTLMPQEFAQRPHWDAWLRTLESQIKAEVPFRDHHLVVCNRHILIYRPCYQVGYFSEGVEAEVKHWSDLRQLDGGRRAVFIHFDEDLEALVAHLNSGVSYDGLVNQQLVGILEAMGLSGATAGPLARKILTGSGESLLDAGADMAQVQGEQEKLRRQAHIETLGNELTGRQLGSPGVAVWLLNNSDELFSSMPIIGEYLRGDREAPTDWQSKCLHLLQADGRDL